MGAIFFYIFIYFAGYYGLNLLNMLTIRPLIKNRHLAALNAVGDFEPGEIAAAAKGTRLAVFVMGLYDLAKETRARPGAQRAAFFATMSLAVTAARAAGITVIDGVYNDIADAAGFEAECRQGLECGFDGKTLIHPSQIERMQRRVCANGGGSRSRARGD